MQGLGAAGFVTEPVRAFHVTRTACPAQVNLLLTSSTLEKSPGMMEGLQQVPRYVL